MRSGRVTWEGAFHHVMSRGLDGKSILGSESLKQTFLQLLRECAKQLHIRIFAYCLMDNHYHFRAKLVRHLNRSPWSSAHEILEDVENPIVGFFPQLEIVYGMEKRNVVIYFCIQNKGERRKRSIDRAS